MSPEVQSRLLYLRGKATACSEDGRLSDEAERLLADAVKLNPTIIDAWNCLGECFWQRGEYRRPSTRFLVRSILSGPRRLSATSPCSYAP